MSESNAETDALRSSSSTASVISSVHRTCARARLALMRGVDDPRFAQTFAAWLAACERAGARMAVASR